MSSVRKKRNFKDLHLPSTPLAAAGPSSVGSSSTVPVPSIAARSGVASETEFSSEGTPNGASTSGTSSQSTKSNVKAADYHDTLSEKLASFGLGYKLVLKNEDLKFLSELGSGNGGTVTKVSARA